MLLAPSFCLYDVFTLFLQLVRMRTSILTESVADTHSFVSGCHLRECYVLQKNILRHAVATLKQAALPLRNRHFTTHAQAFALSAHRAAARQTIFRQRLQASLLFNTVHARSHCLRTLGKPMNGCTPIFYSHEKLLFTPYPFMSFPFCPGS